MNEIEEILYRLVPIAFHSATACEYGHDSSAPALPLPRVAISDETIKTFPLPRFTMLGSTALRL